MGAQLSDRDRSGLGLARFEGVATVRSECVTRASGYAECADESSGEMAVLP